MTEYCIVDAVEPVAVAYLRILAYKYAKLSDGNLEYLLNTLLEKEGSDLRVNVIKGDIVICQKSSNEYYNVNIDDNGNFNFTLYRNFNVVKLGGVEDDGSICYVD